MGEKSTTSEDRKECQATVNVNGIRIAKIDLDFETGPIYIKILLLSDGKSVAETSIDQAHGMFFNDIFRKSFMGMVNELKYRMERLIVEHHPDITGITEVSEPIEV